MTATSFRIVLDTNVLLRGMLSGDSASGRLLRAAEQREFIVIISKAMLAEYRAVLLDAETSARFPVLTPRMVEVILSRLKYLGDYLANPKARFDYPRDPRDAKLVELAVSGEASHIVTHDNDLLSLMKSHSDAGKRFRQRLPHTRVVLPGEFLRQYEVAERHG